MEQHTRGEVRYIGLPLTAQTAYGQLLDAALTSELARSVRSLHGSFASKKVKSRNYWYFQVTDLSGVPRQVYVEPDWEEVRALVGVFSAISE